MSTATAYAPAASRGGENYGWSLKEGTRPFKPQLMGDQVLTDPIDAGSNIDSLAPQALADRPDLYQRLFG